MPQKKQKLFPKLRFLTKLGIIGLTVLFIFIFTHSTLRKGKTVRITSGATLSGITKHLRNRDIIYSTFLFKSVVYTMGESKSLKAGTYFFPAHSSLWTVYKTLMTGHTTFARLTLPEGWTVQQILERIENNPDVNGECPDASDLREGSLLPETYFFEPQSSCSALISQMKQMMEKAVDEAWETRDANLPIKTKEEFKILASIVEKETGIAEERPMVASVFINRLRKRMKLQTDPTVVYAVTKGYGHMRGKAIYRSHLKIDSPYNTYKYAGLPPTPIANPGRDALQAVAHPEKTPYLFFVADGTGGHIFAKTLAEHNYNHQNWREIKKAKQEEDTQKDVIEIK
ncbi:MAG: endolytic transglycosylase MltG [Alphaproteobacteria bacterium]